MKSGEGAPFPGFPGPADDANTARLYAIVARACRRAVVFRRGPSKWVRLLVWELGSDTLVGGQWLKGRIYEQRCDLSPDGEMLSYFAASYRPPFKTWTALSRPPYLTALALWPKGDAWGGGGLFAAPDLLELNHMPGADGAFPLADGFRVPAGLKVCSMGPNSGRGESWPIEYRRLMRDGWTTQWTGKTNHQGRRSRYGWTFDPPHRSQRSVGREATLTVLLHALLENKGVTTCGPRSSSKAQPGATWAAWIGQKPITQATSCLPPMAVYTGSQRATCSNPKQSWWLT